MLGRIFPKRYDNTYRGWRLGIVLLAVLVLLRMAQGVGILVSPEKTATVADSIPVASYGPEAAAAVVLLFSLLGLSLILVALVGAIALIRYRAMIPLAYLLLLAQAFGGRFIVAAHPIVRGGGTMVGPLSFGAAINLATYAVMLLGLVLSLIDRERPAPG